MSIGATLTSSEQTEGLDLFNPLVQSTIGNEAGQELTDINIGGAYDQSSYCSPFIPANIRLAVNLTSARSFNLHPEPYEGQRLAVVDVAGNFATYNLTLVGNGRTIEFDVSEILATDNFYAQWIYRADIADWSRITDLIATDESPLPVEFDDYFIVSLAMRLNPRHGATLSQESMAALTRQRQQIRARYRRPRPKQEVGSLGLLGSGLSGSGTFNPLLP